jgi:hypothetical protein
MSEDHEKWLRKQGVKIVGRHTLHRASMPRFHHEVITDGKIANTTFETTTEQVYQVELDERTLDRLQRLESIVQIAMEHASRVNRTSPDRSGSVGQFYIDNSHRHHELLKENSMYRDAWKEFQTIRVLLGETPHWP